MIINIYKNINILNKRFNKGQEIPFKLINSYIKNNIITTNERIFVLNIPTFFLFPYSLVIFYKKNLNLKNSNNFIYRDGKGRFAKEEKGKIILNLPSLKNILFYLILAIVLFPWIVIVLRLNILPDIITKFEEIMSFPTKSEESQKKNGIFY